MLRHMFEMPERIPLLLPLRQPRPLLAVALCLAFGCRGPAPATTSEALERGHEHIAQGAFESAVEVLERASRESPREAALLGALAEARLGLGEIEAARRSWQRARELDPWEAEYPARLGDLEYRQRHLTEAIDLWREAVRIDPEYAPAHYNLAVGYVERGEERAALDALERYRELEPEDPNGLFLYARTLILLGRSARHPASNGVHPPPLNYAQQGRQAMERYLAMRGQDVPAYTFLGLSYAHSAKDASGEERARLLAQADDYLKKAVYLAPGTAELHHNLGVVSADRSRSAEKRARKLWEDLELPTDEALIARAWSRDEGEQRRAWAEVEAGWTGDAAPLEALRSAIRAVVAAREDMLRYYRRALEADPLFLPSLENLAVEYSRIPGESARALELVERALAREEVPGRRKRLQDLRSRLEADSVEVKPSPGD